MAGRTVDKWTRVYWDGFDISGKARGVGPCGVVYDEAPMTALSDTVKGALKDMAQVNVEHVNSFFDNTATTGIHTVALTAGAKRTVLVAFGQRAEPAQGDPAFGGQFTQGEYRAVSESGSMTINLPFMGWAADATFAHFTRPFGVLLHANAAATGANDQVGVDDNGAASTGGGFMIYQVTASSGGAHTATLSVQDAETNSDGSFAAITGCTTGVITVTAGVSGIVRATPTAIRQYLRWQIALGTATSVTFALAFFRG